MALRNWFFPHTSHAITDLFRRRSLSRSSRPRRGRPTLASLASETLEPRSMMAVTPPSISIDDVTIMEGDAGTKNAAITLRLSEPVSSVVTLRFATANGTATSPVLRGVWVMERLLGVPRLPPPPSPLAFVLPPGQCGEP